MGNDNKELISDVMKSANIINQRSRYGSGNYIIPSPLVSEHMAEVLEEFDMRERVKKRTLVINDIIGSEEE